MAHPAILTEEDLQKSAALSELSPSPETPSIDTRSENESHHGEREEGGDEYEDVGEDEDGDDDAEDKDGNENEHSSENSGEYDEVEDDGAEYDEDEDDKAEDDDGEDEDDKAEDDDSDEDEEDNENDDNEDEYDEDDDEEEYDEDDDEEESEVEVGTSNYFKASNHHRIPSNPHEPKSPKNATPTLLGEDARHVSKCGSSEKHNDGGFRAIGLQLNTNKGVANDVDFDSSNDSDSSYGQSFATLEKANAEEDSDENEDDSDGTRRAQQSCIQEFSPNAIGNNNFSNWTCRDCHDSDQTTSLTLPHPSHDAVSEAAFSELEHQSTLTENFRNTDENARSLRKRTLTTRDEDEAAPIFRKRLRQNPAMSRRSLDNIEKDFERLPSTRSLRMKKHRHVVVTPNGPESLLVTMHVKPSALNLVLSQAPAGYSYEGRGRKRLVPLSTSSTITEPPPAPFTHMSQPFYSFFDRDINEVNGKPYGGILTDLEADTSKTLPTDEDRKRFAEAKSTAEIEWRDRVLRMQSENPAPAKKSKKSRCGSQIECIDFGGWEIDTWYPASYPEEYTRNRVLYICEFCLKYMNSDYVAWRHKLKCPAKHPPGDEIYRHELISVFEVDGRKHPVYCQNLCLLAKLFLGSKTLYYDVEPFLFYILCEYDELGYHLVGYFSKEKRPSSQNNVSCILTLPIHQRKGYGNLLIDFSYLLTRVERKTGSPEKPLSDMGLVSYRSYWRLVLCRFFLERREPDLKLKSGLSIRQISDHTGLTSDDVVSALEGLRCLVRDPESQLYALRVDLNYCRSYVAQWEAKKYVKLKPSALVWTPYVMGRNIANALDSIPGLSRIDDNNGDEDEQSKNEEQPHEFISSQGGVACHQSPVSQTQFISQNDKELQMHISTTDIGEINTNTDYPTVGFIPQHSEAQGASSPKSWYTLYEGIPPTRFRVFPPMTGGRRLEKPKIPSASLFSQPTVPSSLIMDDHQSIMTPTIQKRAPGRPRKSTIQKRKGSGGTGRGPGRWPKGTKKSDYGNADSGPGLPPGWNNATQITDPLRSETELIVSDTPDGDKIVCV
ncbi:Histone acetyltransferase [Ceratocystis pirilliformis]|uniref:Histone acetyltransferase n=1 Tax=Ceratocystis pirilliformis TaxID=259994 RepID=A0ABR3YLB6_9PEZI